MKIDAFYAIVSMTTPEFLGFLEISAFLPFAFLVAPFLVRWLVPLVDMSSYVYFFACPYR